LKGVYCSRGKLILFADADGASCISDVENLERQLLLKTKDGKGVACGSRAMANASVKVLDL
jgi:hypothetical protein